MIDQLATIFTYTDATQKAQAVLKLGAQYGNIPIGARSASWPSRPGRPNQPELCDPRQMPHRTTKGLQGRIALLHALAHIELNAIDLALDIIGRFYNQDMDQCFIDDWMSVATDEAKHFLMINKRLTELDSYYGALPAHDGLWQAACDTSHDLLARLAIIPLVLEARGLDVTPAMIAKLEQNGDTVSANLLTVIYEDEKAHVAFGMKWFNFYCNKQQLTPETHYHQLVKAHFKAGLAPPFNHLARQEAGMPRFFYQQD